MSDQLLVATRKGLFTVTRSGGTSGAAWGVTRAAFLGDSVSVVLPDRRDGSVYAALGHGHFGVKLHRSRDGGQTWAECPAPAYPERPEGAEPDRCPMRGTEVPWSLELVWALEAGGADQPGVIWCGTVPGGLFRSDDGGDSWVMMRSLWDDPLRKKWFGGGLDFPGVHSVCVDPRDSRRVAVGVSCGGVWVTGDFGESWRCRAHGMRAEYLPPERQGEPETQDPHRLVQCRDNPDSMWVQHHNGVFRSTDGADSWRELHNVPPSVFGFAVAVHPEDGDTAWLVPAIKDEKRIPVEGRVVVARTRDGGANWDVLRNGLPQRHAYDIVFRHALDIDRSGDRLAFGSTTGSLWVSEDQGDHWTAVSHHLPPVYAVRFT